MDFTHLRTSHQGHVPCRPMGGGGAMGWSLRGEAEKERGVMWRACTGSNTWTNTRANTLILSHRVAGPGPAYDQTSYICPRRPPRYLLPTSISSCSYVLVPYQCMASHRNYEAKDVDQVQIRRISCQAITQLLWVASELHVNNAVKYQDQFHVIYLFVTTCLRRKESSTFSSSSKIYFHWWSYCHISSSSCSSFVIFITEFLRMI